MPVVLAAIDHHPSIHDLGPSGLSTTAMGELGVLVIVPVLKGPAAITEQSYKSLLDVPVSQL